MKNRLWYKILIVLTLVQVFPSLAFSIVPLKHVRETHIVLSIEILSLDEFGMEGLATFSAEIPTEKKGYLAKAVELQGRGYKETIGVEIEASGKPKGEYRFTMDVTSSIRALDIEDDTKFTRSEEFELLENSSHLMEVYKSVRTGKTIILNISAQGKNVDSFKVHYPSSSTTKVRFQLNIYRISKGKDILLEKNSLSTLLQQPASYYLHLFAGGKKSKKSKLGEEELDIKMTPLEIFNESVDIEVDIEGVILKGTHEKIPVSIKKVENVGNTHSLFVTLAAEEEGGEPQEGYKFEIIPVF
jgi:hypothetical protein